MSDSQNRKRKKVIQVWLTEEEKADIEGNASDSGMSASRYLRTLGLGHVPPSKLDQKNIVELAKINGDQGRLGGLLKMWLTNEERQEAAISKQVRQLIELIEQSQLELLKSVRGLR